MKVEYQLTILVTLQNIYNFFLSEQILPVGWRNLHESGTQPQNWYI